MKKTFHYLGKAIVLLPFLLIFGCKKDTPTPTPTPPCTTCPCTNCPIVPAPTGTVTAVNSSINYGEKATLNYNFRNANLGVWIDGQYMPDTVGTFTTGILFADKTFTIVAKGTGGTTTLPSLKITVGVDPRITFLLSGTFVRDSIIIKPIDSSSASWFSLSPGCSTFVFQYTNQTGVTQADLPPYITPNNPQVITFGPCNTNPGGTLTTGWGFYPYGQVVTFNGYTATNILFWHGIFFDQFIITYDPITLAPKGFKIHDYMAPLIWGGVFQNGERWETYRKL